MNSIGEIFRSARTSRGLTLDDVAVATRINKKFLEEIENDIPLKLPPTYTKAFIRTYAKCLGIDPPALPVQPMESTVNPDIPSVQAPTIVTNNLDAVEPAQEEIESKSGKRSLLRVLLVLVLLIGAGLIASLTILQKDHNTPPVQEISFSDVVKELEAKHNPPTRTKDSLSSAQTSPVSKTITNADSLTLEGFATDVVWLHITIDGVTTNEYTFRPHARKVWKAKKSFLLSLGNGTGLNFTLNGFQMGVLGKSSKPMKNVSITSETLSRLQKNADKKE
jgi:cytoskeletal protein RodZ